jgi:hypothetical protein
VRSKVASALGQLRDRKAIDLLCAPLRDSEYIVQIYAALALIEIEVGITHCTAASALLFYAHFVHNVLIYRCQRNTIILMENITYLIHGYH